MALSKACLPFTMALLIFQIWAYERRVPRETNTESNSNVGFSDERAGLQSSVGESQSELDLYDITTVNKRALSKKKGNRDFQRYKPRKKNHAEFVSLRCGIGGHWEEATKKCIPHDHRSEEKNETSEESMEEATQSAARSSKHSEEVIVGHIVSLHCGMGYSYDKKDHKCKPLPIAR